MAPVLKTIQNKFRKAKEVKCLTHNITIGVAGVKRYEFDESENSWKSQGGAVTYWKDGQYAEITICKCKSCGCK